MKKLLSVAETAELLNVKKSTIYAWIHERRLPFIRVGRLPRFRPEAIEQWLENNTVDRWTDSGDGRMW
jgi:excisionase family DNA binding protein